MIYWKTGLGFLRSQCVEWWTEVNRNACMVLGFKKQPWVRVVEGDKV